MSSMISLPSRSADLVGLVNTTICLVHCLALPVVVSLGGAFFAHPVASWLFVAMAFVAVYFATRRGAHRRVAGLLWGAALLFGAALLLEPMWHWMHDVSLVGSALLIVGHVLNWRQRAACQTRSAS
jgi:hypothetical protein